MLLYDCIVVWWNEDFSNAHRVRLQRRAARVVLFRLSSVFFRSRMTILIVIRNQCRNEYGAKTSS